MFHQGCDLRNVSKVCDIWILATIVDFMSSMVDAHAKMATNTYTTNTSCLQTTPHCHFWPSESCSVPGLLLVSYKIIAHACAWHSDSPVNIIWLHSQ